MAPTRPRRSTSTESTDQQWLLTLFEEQRGPLLPQATRPIEVNRSKLYDLFMCPICLQLLSSTTTTSCLHRFCKECITAALAKKNKECPTCRTKINTQRQLRPDATFDALLALVYPNRDEYEQKEVDDCKQDIRKRSTVTCNPQSEDTEIYGPSPGDLKLKIRPIRAQFIHTPLSSSANTVSKLRIQPQATVAHVARYLELRHNLSPTSLEIDHSVQASANNSKYTYPFGIFTSTGPGEFNPCEAKQTLSEVLSTLTYKNANFDLDLYYTYQMDMPARTEDQGSAGTEDHSQRDEFDPAQ